MEVGDPGWPAEFVRNVRHAFGDTGARWLNDLPALIARCEADWQIQVGPPFTLSYNFVAPATRGDGSQVVLKIGVPNPEIESEMRALRAWAGHGAAALLASLPEHSAFLLERITPGTPLAELYPHEDERATAVAAEVMRALWQAPPDPALRDLRSWTHEFDLIRPGFEGGSGPFPATVLARAERLRADLLASPPPALLLHGDLHHDNVLSSPAGWRVIDPKGLRGDPVFECATFLHNPYRFLDSAPLTERMVARRIDMLVEHLSLDRQRMLDWALVFEVLSNWWEMGPGNMQLAAHGAQQIENLLAITNTPRRRVRTAR